MKLRTRKIIQATILTVLVTIIYISYFVFIGMPRTQARNLYNQAELEIRAGKISDGITDLQSALKSWPEAYIQNELDRIEQLVN